MLPGTNRVLLAAIIVFFLAFGFLFIGSAGDDDSFITYSAAHILAQTGDIINLNGERVEQSSSLLLVLLLAALQKLTQLPVASFGVMASVVAGVLTLLLVWRVAKQMDIRSSFVPVLLLALNPYFIYWSFSGMEVALQALLWLGLLLVVTHIALLGASLSRYLYLMLLVLAQILVRPEASLVLLLGIALFYLFSAYGLGKMSVCRTVPMAGQRILGIMLLVVMMAALVMWWRDMMFGQYFPQPVYAKSAGLDGDRFLQGVLYFLISLDYSLLLGILLLAAGAIFFWRKQGLQLRCLVGALFACVLAQSGFAMASGGDFMAGGRFLAPVIPLLILAAFYGLPTGRAKMPILLLWVAVSLYDTYGFLYKNSLGTIYLDRETLQESCGVAADTPSYGFFETSNRLHMCSLPVAIELEKVVTAIAAVQQPVTILSGQMGLVPYHVIQRHFGAVQFMDRWGLVTREITRCDSARQLERSTLGISLDYSELFAFMDGMGTACNLTEPMVIYDFLNPADVEVIRQRGYTLVFQHGGRVDTLHGGEQFSSAHFIAVRNDLLVQSRP